MESKSKQNSSKSNVRLLFGAYPQKPNVKLAVGISICQKKVISLMYAASRSEAELLAVPRSAVTCKLSDLTTGDSQFDRRAACKPYT